MIPLTVIMTGGLVILVCAAVAWLLLRRSAPSAQAGHPIADRAEQDWSDAKARLVMQMRENDLALAEGRISAEDHAEIGARLADEAETAVSWLRQSRAQARGADGAEEARPGSDLRRRGRWLLIPASVSVVLAVTVAFFAVGLGSDLDMRRSPHADGAPDIGAPDIGAMVARLEARIGEGAPPLPDLQMLMRSYASLGRNDEIPPLFADIFKRFPERMDYRLAFLRGVISNPDLSPLETVGEQIETILLAEPDNLEVRWYRGLTLARSGHFDAARAELEWLKPRIAENPRAQEAISLLLARLPKTDDSGKAQQ